MKKDPALVLIKKDGSQIKYSWQDYEDKAEFVSQTLIKIGVTKGDFIVIAAPNLPESFFVMLGIINIGAVPVPVNTPLLKEPEQKELKYILKDCNPKLFLASSCLSRYLNDIDHITFEELMLTKTLKDQTLKSKKSNNIDMDSLLIMPYTSGTTGGPKGVMLSTKNILDRVLATINELKVTPRERVFSYLSLGHISELIATFFGQIFGRYTVYFSEYSRDLLEDREGFRAAFPKILRMIRPTIFLAVPKVWINIRHQIEHRTHFLPIRLKSGNVLSNLIIKFIIKKTGFDKTRRFISAGSRLDPADKKFFADLNIPINDIYGQTETAGPLTIDGRTIGNVRVTIESGENHEILVSGKNIMLGYYNKPEITALSLKNGIYRTGDIGKKTRNGEIFYAGRRGDRVKNSLGEFVDPERIEQLEDQIRKIDGIDEVVIDAEEKPHLAAIIFSANPNKKLGQDLAKLLPQMGNGFYKIKNFILVNTRELEQTPTLKTKRRKIIEKFQEKLKNNHRLP